jgi:hypothetical protein
MSTLENDTTRLDLERTREVDHDDRQDYDQRERRDPLDWMQGTPPDRPPRGFLDKRRWVETKSAFRTTELLVLILGVTGILVAAWIAEDLDSRLAWALVTAVVVAYLLSRGIAKAGKGTYVDD